MKLNFTSLQYFQKTAELEHLTKAAEELHIAQPVPHHTRAGAGAGGDALRAPGEKYPSDA